MTETMRSVVLVVIAVLVLFVVLPLIWGGGMMGAGYMGPGMMAGWWWGGSPVSGGLTFVFWVLILVGIGLLALWGMRRIGPGETAPRQPLDILKERYARGDLTREQYDQMRHDLEA